MPAAGSSRLTPGALARCVIGALGLQSFLLTHNEETSHASLRGQAASLHEHDAVGMGSNVAGAAAQAR